MTQFRILSETNAMVEPGMIASSVCSSRRGRFDEGGSSRQVEKERGFCRSWRIN